jgi:ankyrin repeat protein
MPPSRAAVAKLLLAQKGLDPDSKDIYDHTPLSRAAANGSEAIVKLLIAREGVDLDSRDIYRSANSSVALQLFQPTTPQTFVCCPIG